MIKLIAILYMVLFAAGLGIIAGIIRVIINDKTYNHIKKYERRYKTLAGLIIIALFLWYANNQGWITPKPCNSYDSYACND